MRVYLILLFAIIALTLLVAMYPKPSEVGLEDMWSEILNATKAENDSAVLGRMELHIKNGSVDRALIHFCDSRKCYEAELNGWLSVSEANENVGYAHPHEVLKYISDIIDALNLTAANVSVEIVGEVYNCYTLKDEFIIPIKKLKSKVLYVIDVNSMKFVLWKDVIDADFVEPIFLVRVLDFNGKSIANAKVIMRSDANPLYSFAAETNESGVAMLNNRYTLKVFEYPFDIIVEAGDLRKKTTIFKAWNAELVFSKRTKLIAENFKLELEVDDIVERGDVNFRPKLIYKGSKPITIYFGHVHPFRVEVWNESGMVCRLPEIHLDILSKRTVEPNSELSANMSCKLDKGIYEAVTYVELSAYGDLREEVILRSNPVIVRVI